MMSRPILSNPFCSPKARLGQGGFECVTAIGKMAGATVGGRRRGGGVGRSDLSFELRMRDL